MTVFGTRDFAPIDRAGPLPRAELVGEPSEPSEPSDPSLPLPAVVPLPRSHDTRRIVITVQGGEEIEIGRVEGREPAVVIARDAIRRIERAQSEQEWPEVGDRFLRPEAIVSIDVQRADAA